MVDHDIAPAVYTRVCRRCSAQSSVAGPNCPSCGTAFVRRSWAPKRKHLLVAVILIVLIGGAGGALAVKQSRDAAESARAAAAEARAAEAAEKTQQAAADDAERSTRADIVVELEKNITKSARKAVSDGLLDGPIKYSSCTAVGGSTDDLTALTGTFDCLAVNKENDDGTASGYSYSGTADWGDGEIGWQLGG